MIINKEKLESWQNYDIYPDRIAPEPEPKLCPYCKDAELDDQDDYACEACKKDLKQLN
jgi:hypothetical protein